ncbi:MAG: 16S rRNA (adenine(1518)-N(6)/adenine(1519)-N(6))-dimethyltransferase RsmA [Leptonema sp. (in: bacteria)]
MKYPFYSPRVILEVLKESKGSIQKKLGQNFLIDPNYIEKISNAIRERIPNKADVLEIGPGLGALSHKLIENYNLYCVEIDPILTKILKNILSDINVVNLDILEYLDKNKENEFLYFVGNLPYYITTDILVKVIQLKNQTPKKCIFLVQKEYADKLLEKGNSISIFIHNFAEVNRILKVPKSSFFPKPKVESALIELNLFEKEKCDALVLEKVLRMSFRGKRKKMINSWLMGEEILPIPILVAASQLLGIDINLRAEEIDPNLYYQLAQKIRHPIN